MPSGVSRLGVPTLAAALSLLPACAEPQFDVEAFAIGGEVRVHVVSTFREDCRDVGDWYLYHDGPRGSGSSLDLSPERPECTPHPDGYQSVHTADVDSWLRGWTGTGVDVSLVREATGESHGGYHLQCDRDRVEEEDSDEPSAEPVGQNQEVYGGQSSGWVLDCTMTQGWREGSPI